MVKFSKKLEYALIALRHISEGSGQISTARDISGKYNIPHDLLAKILQKLKKENILLSIQGINGGYRLERDLNEIMLSELYSIVDGSTAIVECASTEENECYIGDNCTIKDPIIRIQSEFENLLKSKRVADFIS